ncbi:MAG: hypothetical protein P8Z37_07555, partial [Acidobacteriota bacterium]
MAQTHSRLTTAPAEQTSKSRSRRIPGKRRVIPEDIKRFVLVSDAQIAPDGSRVLFSRQHI